MKKIIIAIVAVLFVGLISVAAVFFYMTKPQGDISHVVNFEIMQGDGINSISRKLIEEGLIQSGSGKVFSLLARYLKHDRGLKTGYYELDASMNMIDILESFSSGRNQVLEKFVVVEGKNIYEVADMFEERGLVSRFDFLTAASNESILKEYNIPTPTVEGYLFPSTYHIAKGHSADTYIRLMIDTLFQQFPKEELEERSKELGLTFHEVLTLASIIEKEAGAVEERPLVASVFYNRLDRNIRLESCATTIYAIALQSGGTISQPKLKAEHTRMTIPYNTYRNSGLPPGPISSVSRASLNSVLYPDESNYLFFVSKRNGFHEFSETYSQHNINIDKYLR